MTSHDRSSTSHDRSSSDWWYAVRDIRGWLSLTEASLLRMAGTLTANTPGNLLEIGAYRGQSACVLGFTLGADDELCVIDPFGLEASSAAVRVEQELWYEGLSRSAFETNYRTVHGGLPRIVQQFSSDVSATDLPAPFRVIHVDGAHDYESVKGDIALCLPMLRDGGIVVFDDIVNDHSPGVSAAVWSAVTGGELAPLLITSKLYACRPGDHDELHARIERWLHTEHWQSSDLAPLTIAGFDVIRDPVPPGAKTGYEDRAPAEPGGVHGIVRDWVPPIVLTAARRAKHRRRP